MGSADVLDTIFQRVRHGSGRAREHYKVMEARFSIRGLRETLKFIMYGMGEIIQMLKKNLRNLLMYGVGGVKNNS
jgi:nicotinic acid phosphoribosyltransferase